MLREYLYVAKRMEKELYSVLAPFMLRSVGEDIRGADQPELFARLVHGVMPYMSNIVLLVGHAGAGKSTLLASYAAHHRSRLYEALLGRGTDVGVVHMVSDVIDLTLIPATDRVINWMLYSLYQLLDDLRYTLSKRYGCCASSETINTIESLMQDFRDNVLNAAVTLHLEAHNLLNVAAELEDYRSIAMEALHSGYTLALQYARFALKLRRELTRELGGNAELGLIIYVLDDLDSITVKRLLETLIACKLLSLDPYTVCIASTRTKIVPGSPGDTATAGSGATSCCYLRDRTEPEEVVQIDSIIEKMLHDAPAVVEMEPVTCSDIYNHIPLQLVKLAGPHRNRATSYKSLGSLAEKYILHNGVCSLSLADIIFDDTLYTLEECNIYAKNLYVLRYLDKLYVILQEATHNRDITKKVDKPRDILKILDVLSRSITDARKATLLARLAHMLTTDNYVLELDLDSDAEYVKLLDIEGIYAVYYNVGAHHPRLKLPLEAWQVFETNYANEESRAAIIAALMRDLAAQTGANVGLRYNNIWILSFGTPEAPYTHFSMPFMHFQSLKYYYKLLKLYAKLAECTKIFMLKERQLIIDLHLRRREFGIALLLYLIYMNAYINLLLYVHSACKCIRHNQKPSINICDKLKRYIDVLARLCEDSMIAEFKAFKEKISQMIEEIDTYNALIKEIEEMLIKVPSSNEPTIKAEFIKLLDKKRQEIEILINSLVGAARAIGGVIESVVDFLVSLRAEGNIKFVRNYAIEPRILVDFAFDHVSLYQGLYGFVGGVIGVKEINAALLLLILLLFDIVLGAGG